ncbi:fungal-specific transcription factor domain-containing protein [Aspergillus multicolor]|uniref:Zn(II)2Cys6 transcription factor n=1 Tax=Aspergillus multicolor TaxID=41759 RepID=UPI003CCD93ED
MDKTNSTLEKPCHTCRRRRVKCDQAKPHCRKCVSNDLECLGYGKLILFVGGVASRGKMMGKTFSEKSSGVPVEAKPASRTQMQTKPTNSLDPMNCRSKSNLLSHIPLDPWLQGLDYHTRHYLAHFLVHVSNDLVVYNYPAQNQNPIGFLLGFAGAEQNSALFNTVVSMSAHHLYNLSSRPETPEAQKYQVDALRFKGRALQLLSQDVSNVHPSKYTTLLASSMLLCDLALLESGDDTWRIHLGAATRLVRFITARMSDSMAVEETRMSGDEKSFCSWIMSRIILQDMFGSSLSTTPASWNLQELCGMDRALRLAEVDHYSSCPSQISQLIISASSSYDMQSAAPSCCSDALTAQCILLSIQFFDPTSWALDLQSQTPAADDFAERCHVGSAYKAAAALYVSQVISESHEYSCNHLPTPEQRRELVTTVLHHAFHIPCDNPLFKSTIWPVFIAGAETTNPHDRTKVLLHWKELSRVVPWQSTVTAEQALKEIWARVDAASLVAESELEMTTQWKWLAEFQTIGASIYPA